MFGERVEGYAIPVVNEREVRAGAGILFFVTLVVFLGAWHVDLLLPAQMMIIAFFGDFLIRVFNPRYSPSLILGRIAVANQKPEYTAAAPKRFAWTIGLGLATFMLVTLIFMQNMSALNFTICGICIVLLFMESSFGICLGCLIYNKVLGRELELCPGGVCEVRQKEPVQFVHAGQIGLLAAFAVALYGLVGVMEAQNSAHGGHGPNHRIIHDLKSQGGAEAMSGMSAMGAANAAPAGAQAGHDQHSQHDHSKH
jgi:hypothetical protein